MKNILLLMLVLGLFSCGRTRTVNDAINLQYIDTLSLESITRSISVIPLELTENSLIDNVTRVIMHDDYLIIVDDSHTSKAITLFDYSGKYLRRINNFGRGPGEYLSITALDFDQTNLDFYIYDNFSRAVYIYNYQGSFTKKIDVDGIIASDFKLLDANTFAFYSPDEFSDFQNNTYPKGLLVLDLKENQLKNLLEYSKDTEIIRAFNSVWFTQGKSYIGLLSSIESKYFKVTVDRAILEYSFLIPVKEIGDSEYLKGPAFKAYPVESKKYIFFYIFYKDGKQFYPVLIDKESANGYIYSWVKGFLDTTATIFQGANQDSFFRVIQPERLTVEEKRALSRDYGISISENDNPLLVIYHLK